MTTPGKVVGVSLLVFAAIAALSLSRNRSSEPSVTELTTSATAACRLALENVLRAPSTAEFLQTETTRYPDNRIRVTGRVDAQNAFGAMLRKPYLCEVTFRTADPQVYRLVFEDFECRGVTDCSGGP